MNGTPENSRSAVGNLADLADGQVLLPPFVGRRPDGVFADPSAMAGESDFRDFAERVFAAGARFAGLDYELFERLLDDARALAPGGPVRLAADIVPFASERRGLYKTVKIVDQGGKAEYVFEPAYLEIVSEEPSFGPAMQVERVPTPLDFDEFVADMWTKELRYGIDAELVRQVIASGEMVRLTVARARPAQPGQDATLEEKTQALHRDDSPKILPDGRIDLRQFKNRFPQVAADTALLRKVPRALGRHGRDVRGERLEPPLPKDFELAPLAGEGTRIEQRGDGEYIVAARDGFLNLDAASSQVSVTEKMVSRQGVSLRTTGDLTLTGDGFEEYGEVQEKRVVEGRDMTFFGPVFGDIVSHGGEVLLKSTVAGGRVSSPGGRIIVEGRASTASFRAPGGEMTLRYAEGSTLLASHIVVEHAVSCTVIGDSVEIGRAEGCAVAGRKVRIASSGERRDVETVVSVLVPDLAGYARRLGELRSDLAGLERARADKAREIETARAVDELANYLALEARIRKGEVNLNATQEAAWRKAGERFAPALRRLRELQQEAARFEKSRAVVRADLAALEEERLRACAGIGCEIQGADGETAVRTLAYQPNQPLLADSQVAEFQKRMRSYGDARERLFAAAAGSFSWRFEPPESA